MYQDYNQQNLTKRKALVTLSNGSKVMMDFYLPIKERTNYEDLEANIVKTFQKSQPNMVNKVIKVHLMRN